MAISSRTDEQANTKRLHLKLSQKRKKVAAKKRKKKELRNALLN